MKREGGVMTIIDSEMRHGQEHAAHLRLFLEQQAQLKSSSLLLF